MELNPFIAPSIALASVVATVIIGFVSNGILRKQHRINGLQDAFKVLNSEKNRSDRQRVYELYHEYEETKNIQVFRNPEVANIRADFDVIGVLVKHKNIDKKIFLYEYGPLVSRCWVCIKDSVYDERKRRKFKPYMENFEWLAEQADKYWADKGVDLSKTPIYDTRQKS